MHIQSDLTAAHRAAALLAAWDKTMAEVEAYVAMDRARRQGTSQDATMKGEKAMVSTSTVRTEPRPRSAHSDEFGMTLPVDKTCGDCARFKSCQGFIGAIASDEICDWSPSRFLVRESSLSSPTAAE